MRLVAEYESGRSGALNASKFRPLWCMRDKRIAPWGVYLFMRASMASYSAPMLSL